MKVLFSALICATVALAQPTKMSVPAQAIDNRLHKLRSLPDDTRETETRALAIAIRGLPLAAEELVLSLALSNYATEGDFGTQTLQDVGDTIVAAVEKNSNGREPAYDELARLAHYEGVTVKLEDRGFVKAMAALDETDRIRQASDLSLRDLDGKMWTLRQLRGKVVLVNFWATWCPPCRKEMPDLEALYRRFGPKGLVILAISDEEDAKVRPFIAEQKYSYPVLLDPGRVVNERFRIQGIPKSLVYDRAGKLVAQSSDMRTRGQFLAMLKRAGLGE